MFRIFFARSLTHSHKTLLILLHCVFVSPFFFFRIFLFYYFSPSSCLLLLFLFAYYGINTCTVPGIVPVLIPGLNSFTSSRNLHRTNKESCFLAIIIEATKHVILYNLNYIFNKTKRTTTKRLLE